MNPRLDSPFMVAVWEGLRNGHGVWEIQNRRSRDPLGGIFWYSRWRRYVFIPASDDVVLSGDCMKALADFIATLPLRQVTSRRELEALA